MQSGLAGHFDCGRGFGCAEEMTGIRELARGNLNGLEEPFEVPVGLVD